VGLKEFIVDTVDTVKELIEEANERRSTGSTAANSDSSRSHSIMQFALKRTAPDGSGYKLVGGRRSVLGRAGRWALGLQLQCRRRATDGCRLAGAQPGAWAFGQQAGRR
jgi:hypothetical protein